MNVSVKDFECVGFSGFYQGAFDIGENLYVTIREEEEYYFNIPTDSLVEDVDYTFDYDAYKRSVCEGWGETMQSLINDYLGIDCTLVNPDLVQPRAYNYANDRLFLNFKCRNFKWVMNHKVLPLMRKHKEKLAEIIHDNHTSYDGFCSFMPNTYDEWYTYLACSKNYKDRDFFLYFSHIIIYLIGLEKYPTSKRIGTDLFSWIEIAVYEDYGDIYEHINYIPDSFSVREKYAVDE